MKRQKLTVLAIAAAVMALGLLGCSDSTGGGGTTPDGGDTPSGTALWARSVSAGTDASWFLSVAVDSAGNVYAAGYQAGTDSYTYGTGVTARGTASGSPLDNNAVLVKYDSTGTALWAKSVNSGSSCSRFNSVAVDSAGNVYAAGWQYGDSVTYGTGVSAQGAYSAYNVVLVKYDSDGTALWAKSVSAGAEQSQFNSVAVDSAGNVYAAGYQYGGTGSLDYGNSVTAQGTNSTYNVVLVKYDSSGDAQWAKSVSAGADQSQFYSVAVDSLGNVYAAGYQYGTGSYTYGTGASVAGTASYNVVLVKYDSSGTAQWAKSVSTGSDGSRFNSVAVDSAGNVYAAGLQSGSGSVTYGPSVSAQGTASYNVVLVKYDSGGTAQWAKSVSTGSVRSEFYSVAVDSLGNVYAAGSQSGTDSYTYGTGVSVAGTNSTGTLPYNVVLVKYNAGGTAQWAKSVSAGAARSQFSSVTADSAGNVYAAGLQSGTGSYTYGTGVSVAGTNIVMIRFLLMRCW